MKNKILYVFFVVTALMCCFAFSAFAGYDVDEDAILELDKVESLDECYSAGDADNDGSTSASDARLILRASVNLDNIDASNFVKSDVDGDGKLTAQDARLALRLSVGLDEFPEHNIVDIVIVPATCSTEGLSVKLCTGCIKLYAVFTTPTADHVGGLWETITEADCLQEGKAQMKCILCETVLKQTSIAKTGHSGEWTYPDGKSCIDPVKKIRTCAVCSAIEETTENPPGAHSFKWETVTENTCTENGLDVYKCSHCGQESNSVVTKAHGHLYERSVVSVEPTCTETGIKADECVFCGDRQNESSVPANGHKYDNMHYKVTNEPTCAETGTADVLCSVCGDTREIILEKTEHILTQDWTQTLAATCTEKGSEEGICRYCGPVTRDIPALGHTVTKWVNVKPATCAEEGLKRGYCSVCTSEAVEEAIPTIDHTFNEKDANGKVIVHHTEGKLCEEDGKGYVLCTECGYKKYGTITSIGHCVAGSTKVVTAADCTTDETTIQICMFCNEEIAGSEKTNKGTKLGHAWGEWINSKEATCSENGTKTKTCTRCGETQDEAIPSIGHKPGEWITEIETTCHSEGKSTLLCTVCNTVLQTKTTDKTEHTPGKTVIESAATPTGDGTCSVYCSVCNEKIETKPFTRIKVDSTFTVEFTEDCDVASGGTVSFTVENATDNMLVRYSYGIEGDIIESTITELNGIYSFTIPAELSDTAVITIKVFDLG